MPDDRGAVVKSNRFEKEFRTAKGAAAEVNEPHNEVSKSAGLRENMSQTVTKVESCHWSRAE